MPSYLHKNRYYIDPHEEPVRKGDHVILSDLNIPWEVTRVAKDHSVVYLRSLPEWGSRSGVESPARLKAAWRDKSTVREIDWSQAYDVDEL